MDGNPVFNMAKPVRFDTLDDLLQAPAPIADLTQENQAIICNDNAVWPLDTSNVHIEANEASEASDSLRYLYLHFDAVNNAVAAATKSESGFMTLKVVSVRAVYDGLPDIYTLSSLDGKKQYEFTPHYGLARL